MKNALLCILLLASIILACSVLTFSGTDQFSSSKSVMSDQRLKKNMHPLEDSLKKMLKLSGKNFEWKNPSNHNNQTGVQTGFIAQEVEAIFPAWVNTDSNGYKNLAMQGFEALTVEAVRELKTDTDNRLETLEHKIKSLEAQSSLMKKRLKELEHLVPSSDVLISK